MFLSLKSVECSHQDNLAEPKDPSTVALYCRLMVAPQRAPWVVRGNWRGLE